MLESKVKYPKQMYRLKYPKEIMFNQEMKKYNFIIYTDGGFNRRFKLGSWSYLIKVKYDNKRFKFHKDSGVVKLPQNTCPVLMEITAVIEAIKYIIDEEKQKKYGFSINTITVYSDNTQVVYSRNMIKKYIENEWYFLQSDKEVTESLKRAWMELDELNEKYNIKYLWVRAHDGNVSNEYVDGICTSRIKTVVHEEKIFKYNNFQLRK
jgi:ribonuclease HI